MSLHEGEQKLSFRDQLLADGGIEQLIDQDRSPYFQAIARGPGGIIMKGNLSGYNGEIGYEVIVPPLGWRNATRKERLFFGLEDFYGPNNEYIGESQGTFISGEEADALNRRVYRAYHIKEINDTTARNREEQPELMSSKFAFKDPPRPRHQ